MLGKNRSHGIEEGLLAIGGPRPTSLHVKALALLTFLGLATVGAQARQAETAPKVVRVSLQQAIQMALAQHPKVHLALLAVAESADDRTASTAALLPTLEAHAFGQRNAYNPEALMGSKFPGFPQVMGPYNWGTAGLEAHATLFDLSLWKKWKASSYAQDATKARGRAVREEIGALVVGQYLLALRASESLKAAQSRVDLADALEKLAESQQKEGVGTRLDTLRAKVQLQTERQRLIQSETQRTTALAGLSRLLVLEPGTPIELLDTLAAPSLPAFTFQEAFDTALRQRPELMALDAQERAAASLREAAWSLNLPSLTASASWGVTGLQSSAWPRTYQLSVGLRVPLFTGGLVSSQVSRAKAEESRVQEARRDVRSQVGYAVKVAQEEMNSARNEVDVTTLAVTLSDEVLVQARHRFEAGVSSNIDVIHAQDELARAQDNRINALFRLNQARADLAQAMGQLESLFAEDGASHDR